MNEQIPEQFGYSEEHVLLRREARRFLAERCPREEVRRLWDTDPGYSPDLYRAMAEMGWIGISTAEEAGGSGGDFLSQVVLCEEMGRALAGTPYLATTMATLALGESQEEAKTAWMPKLCGGDNLATVALTEEDGSWETESVTATAERTGDGYILRGTKTHVLWAPETLLLIAPFQTDGDRALFAVPLPHANIQVDEERGVDRSRRAARVRFEAATVPASARLSDCGLAAIRRLHRRGFVLLAAEMVGSAETLLSMTIDYAKERTQFGRAIGSFQAVKHPLVNVMIAIEKARSLVYAAAAHVEAAVDDADIPARMAKAAAGDAVQYAADRAVQFHGGFGFTWDCDVHYFFKRALWGNATLGDPRHHRRHIAEALIDRPRETTL